MAGNDSKRRFLRQRGSVARPTDGAGAPNSPAAAPPAGAAVPPQPRPARPQAAQDITDLVGFLREVDSRRAQGRPAPAPKDRTEVLGAFRGQPAQQTTIQILAAAAAARHVGAHSKIIRKWAQLAQDNAARLKALRAQQYRTEQQRYTQAQMPPDEIARRLTERQAADREADTRIFDAAAAVALSYAAAKSVPSLDKLAELSAQHLAVEVPTADVPASTAESFARVTDEYTADADTVEIDFDKNADRSPAPSGPETRTEPAAAVEEGHDADVSDQLERVDERAPANRGDLGKIGAVLESAGRGIATAIGPINGDDDVAAPLSPVDPNQLNQDLLDAIAAAMSSHPRSVTEMLNIERRPDHTNEAAFVPDNGVEYVQEATLSH